MRRFFFVIALAWELAPLFGLLPIDMRQRQVVSKAGTVKKQRLSRCHPFPHAADYRRMLISLPGANLKHRIPGLRG